MEELCGNSRRFRNPCPDWNLLLREILDPWNLHVGFRKLVGLGYRFRPGSFTERFNNPESILSLVSLPGPLLSTVAGWNQRVVARLHHAGDE